VVLVGYFTCCSWKKVALEFFGRYFRRRQWLGERRPMPLCPLLIFQTTLLILITKNRLISTNCSVDFGCAVVYNILLLPRRDSLRHSSVNWCPWRLSFCCYSWHVGVLLIAPSGPPQMVEAVPVDTSSVRVTWRPPSERQQNGLITGYRVMYASQWQIQWMDESSAQPPRNVANIMMTGTDRSCLIEGLATWTVYRIWVSAFTSAGQGPHSDMIVVQTDEGGTMHSPVSIVHWRHRPLRPKIYCCFR